MLLLLGTLALALYVWSSIEGYNLADTVESVSLANRIVRDGELTVSARSVRPAALPLLYTPFIYVDRWLTGPVDQRIAFPLARGFQALLSVAFVWATMRLGSRIAGARGGVAAGVLAAVNPFFLRYAVDPLPGLAAGTLFALGLERLIVRGTFRRALQGGLFVGAAMIIAYKTIPLAGALFLAILARDRWKHRAGWLGLGLGMLVGLGIGCLVDYRVYGDFGLSLTNYLVYNIFATVYPALLKLGLDDTAAWLGSLTSSYYGTETQVNPSNMEARIQAHTPVTWYVTNSLKFLVWPALALVLLGVLRSVRRPRWATTIVLFIAGAFIAVLSAKHSKEYRLMLPVLPLIASLGGLGWVVLAGPVPGSLRSFAASLLFLVAGFLGLRQFHEAMPRAYGAYPQGVEWINQKALAEGAVHRTAAAEPYNLFFRTSAQQEHHILRMQPRAWPNERAASPVRQVVLKEWNKLTWLISSGATLSTRAGLRAEIDHAFELDAAFYDKGHHMTAQGPLHVFRNRERGGGAERMFAFLPQTKPLDWRAERQFGRPIQFKREGARPPQVLNLLGSEMFEVPGSGLIALRLHWTIPTTLESNFVVFVRITTNDGHQIAYGRLPVSFSPVEPADWPSGQVAVDTRLMGIRAQSLRDRGGVRDVKLTIHLGRRGDRQPEWLMPFRDQEPVGGDTPTPEVVVQPRWIGEDSPL